MVRAHRAGDSLDRALRWATALYALGLAAHFADHLRRGTGVITGEVFWAGIVSTTLGVATIALVVAGHRLAPLAAALVGIPAAVGVAAVHLLPHWSALSDAFPGGSATGVTAMSWTVVMLEILGAAAMGVVGLRIVAAHGVRRARGTAG
jgi:hypothetical protein